MNAKDKVRGVVRDQLGAGDSEFTDDQDIICELCMDSLHTIEILMALEGFFSVEIEDSHAEKLRTVNDVVKYLNDEHGIK